MDKAPGRPVTEPMRSQPPGAPPPGPDPASPPTSGSGPAGSGAPDPRLPRAQQAGSELLARKRRVYLVAIVFAMVVTALSWVTREPGDLILERGYPLLFVALVGFAAVLARSDVALRPLEFTMLGVVGAAILGRLTWHLHFAGPLDEHLLVLAGAHYWSVAVLVVGCFVVLDRRGGLWLGIGILAFSAALVAGAVWRELQLDGVFPTGEVLVLARVHGFLAALLALVVAVAGLHEQLFRALARAEALDERASTDPMTGLANRWSGQEVLVREREAASRYGRSLSVIMLDLDHFKRINDERGHAAGDRVLRVVGDALRTTVRHVDTATRWGGEEFLVIAPDTTIDDAEQLAHRCHEAIRGVRPGEDIALTATFGVAQLQPGETLDELLDRVDGLLYRGKALGRDRVVSGPD